MKRRDLIKKLKAAGYGPVREGGKHSIYKAEGKPPVQVPRHNELNEKTANQILKAAGLK